MKTPRLNLVHVLVGAIVLGGSFAAFGSGTPPADNAPAPAPVAAQPRSEAPDDGAEAPSDAAGTVEGDVLELLDVAQYTYARIGKKGSEGTWVAFPSAKLEAGAHVRLVGATEMTNFASKTLNRTFPSIWFGTLDAGGAKSSRASVAGVHAEAADPLGGANPHANAASSNVAVQKVDRAPGPNGKTVAQAIAARTELAGKTVRVRATVVKSTPGVLGHTYLHLRDGSGDASAGTNDLSATTDVPIAVGETVLLEGTLALDRDIGSGYKFAQILEDAKVVTP